MNFCVWTQESSEARAMRAMQMRSCYSVTILMAHSQLRPLPYMFALDHDNQECHTVSTFLYLPCRMTPLSDWNKVVLRVNYQKATTNTHQIALIDCYVYADAVHCRSFYQCYRCTSVFERIVDSDLRLFRLRMALWPLEQKIFRQNLW